MGCSENTRFLIGRLNTKVRPLIHADEDVPVGSHRDVGDGIESAKNFAGVFVGDFHDDVGIEIEFDCALMFIFCALGGCL